MKTIILTVFTILFIICLCSLGIYAQSNETKPILKLSVLQSGKVIIDGNEASIGQVEKRLDQLKTQGGEVWYYREAGFQDPPPEAMQVIKLVADRGLPITLSSKPDFSDYIDMDGQSHPRN